MILKLKENVLFIRFDIVFKEYARYLPFGLAVASTFLQDLHDPFITDIRAHRTIEEVIRNIFDRGGDVVNDELCSLVVNIFNLHKQLNLNFENL